MVAPLGDPVTLTELGCGSGEKLAMIAEALRLRRRPRGACTSSTSRRRRSSCPSARSARFEHVSVVGHRATYEEGLRHAARERSSGGAMLVLFLGSNIGNFDPPAADEFLAEIRRSLRPGDALLLGADLVKPERELLLAYDDPLGVTAAFNKNLLARMNTRAARGLRPRRPSPTAPSGTPASGASRCTSCRGAPRRVRIPRAELRSRVRRGRVDLDRELLQVRRRRDRRDRRGGGFRCHEQWIEPEARFALTLFLVA